MKDVNEMTRRELIAELRALRAHRRETEVPGWPAQATLDAPDPILIVDATGRMMAWNEAAAAVLGGEARRGAVVDAFLRTSTGAGMQELIERVFGEAALVRAEVIVGADDVAGHPYLAHLYALRQAGGEVQACIVATTDLSDRLAYEQALLEAKETAESTAHLKTMVLNNLSHEIRTPLTAILGFAELLMEETTDQQHEFVDLIRRSGQRLMRTVVSVLELARLESGDVVLTFETLDLGKEAEEVAEMFARQVEEKGLALQVVRHSEARASVDQTAINRILSNLVANAVKFTSRGHIRMEAGRDDDGSYVRVSDTGPGISDTFMPHLFEEFRQESERFPRQHEGSGLGLAITKRLVDRMSGTIEVESKVGAGTTFTVRFPFV